MRDRRRTSGAFLGHSGEGAIQAREGVDPAVIMRAAMILLAWCVLIAVPSASFARDSPAVTPVNLALCVSCVHTLVDTAALLGLSKRPSPPDELAARIRREADEFRSRLAADGGTYSDEQRLWYAHGVVPDANRVPLARRATGLVVRPIAFGNATDRHDVLDWLGNARTLNVPLNGNTELVLADRTKISIGWAAPFAEANTAPGPFNGVRAVSSVPFLRRVGDYESVEAGGDLFVRVPLKARLSVWLYEPRSPDILASRGFAWLRKTTTLMASPGRTPEVSDLRFPRFTVTATTSVVPVARDDAAAGTIGLGDVLGVAPPLTRIMQLTEFAATEGGISIVSTTVAHAKKKARRMPPILSIDRPFGFLVRDDATGKLILAGTVMQL